MPGLRALRAAWPRLVVGTGLLTGALTGCDDETRSRDHAPPDALHREIMSERIGDVLPLTGPPAPAPLPRDRDAMLEALAPLPTDSLLVVYEIEAPAGIGGSLEVLARPGGYRRENWTLEVPVDAGEPRRLSGSTIQTPDGIWIEGADAQTIAPSVLGALADAALALDDGPRRAVVDRLEIRRAELDRARADDVSEPEHILDTPCHVTRVATVEMCLWEATGLPLRYRGDGIELRAVNIETDASIGAHAFELPSGVPTEPELEFDATQAIERLIDGDLAGLSPYLHPGLRLPTSA